METFDVLRTSMRSSFRRVAEKSPLSPRSKGSKVTPKGDESGPQPPPSPSENRRVWGEEVGEHSLTSRV